MKTYSETDIFSAEDLRAFRLATAIVARFPDEDVHGNALRCHEVASAVGRLLKIPVEHGVYEVGAQHSWLRLPSGHILDAYAVGRLPPVILVAVVVAVPVRYEKLSPARLSFNTNEETVRWLVERTCNDRGLYEEVSE